MPEADSRLAVFLLTGFLGSGKTTLLAALLQGDAGRDTAVVINEFGEIGLDHLILGRIEGEAVALQNGCVCCALRTDLKQTLQDLLDRSMRGEIPRFNRVVIETTGLADPVPILETLTSDILLRHHFRHEATIVTLDAILGEGQLRRHPESVRQLALADRVILTKTDIATAEEVEETRRAAAAINPGTRLSEGPLTQDAVGSLLEAAEGDAESRLNAVRAWLDAFERNDVPVHGRRDGAASDLRSLALDVREPLDWNAFGVWLSALLHRHGRRILRTKGILDVSDAAGPVILQAAESVIHPPVHMGAWPDDARGSRIVFITRGLDPEDIRRSLEVFLAAAARMSGSGEAAA
ncbi:MAG: GTP-binding protein [Rhizobiales bacterium]|nr:GTP-binding protein [Hyphomicrobiales bacterium]